MQNEPKNDLNSQQAHDQGSDEIVDSRAVLLQRLAAANAKQAQMRADGALEILDPLEKARRDPKSMRKAVTAMCWQCMGGNGTPNVKWEVANCLSRE